MQTWTQIVRAGTLLLVVGMLVQSAGLAGAQTIIQPFGDGWLIQPPFPPVGQGQGGVVWNPPTIVQPFGDGWIATTPGRPPTTIQPFGDGWLIQEPSPPVRFGR